jgi:hypothetical protein
MSLPPAGISALELWKRGGGGRGAGGVYCIVQACSRHRHETIEEGRGQSINFRLLKCASGCAQRHSLKFTILPLVTINICVVCTVQSVAGKGCVGLC